MKNKISIRRLILMSLCTLNASHHLLQAKLSPKQENTFRNNAVKALNEGNANEVQAIIKRLSSLGEIALANEILQLAQQKGFSTQDSSTNKGFGKGNVSENVITDQALLIAYENAIKLLDDETIKNWKTILQGIIDESSIDTNAQSWLNFIFGSNKDFIKLIDPKKVALLNQLSTILDAQLNAKNTQSSDNLFSDVNIATLKTRYNDVLNNPDLEKAVLEEIIALIEDVRDGKVLNDRQIELVKWLFPLDNHKNAFLMLASKDVKILSDLHTLATKRLNTMPNKNDQSYSLDIQNLIQRYNDFLKNPTLDKTTLDKILLIFSELNENVLLDAEELNLITSVFLDKNLSNAFLNLNNTHPDLLFELYTLGKERYDAMPDPVEYSALNLSQDELNELANHSQEALNIVKTHEALNFMRNAGNPIIAKRLALVILGVDAKKLTDEQVDSDAIKQAANKNRKLLLKKYNGDGEEAKKLPNTIGRIQAALAEAGQVLGLK